MQRVLGILAIVGVGFLAYQAYKNMQKQNKPKDLASQTEEYKGKGIKFQPPIPKANYTVPKKPGVK